MLEVLNLACQRGDRILFRKLGLCVEPRGLVRVAGANGVGKTSFLRLLTGLATPPAGEVRWQGQDIRMHRDGFHAALLYLGHAAALNDLLTPLENLRFACAGAGDPSSEEECVAALHRIGLRRQIHLPAKVLSQGQRRRVGLARLFLAAHRPLWILDEPFTALDVHAVGDLAACMDAHCERGGMVLFTSHQDVGFRMPVTELDLAEVAL